MADGLMGDQKRNQHPCERMLEVFPDENQGGGQQQNAEENASFERNIGQIVPPRVDPERVDMALQDVFVQVIQRGAGPYSVESAIRSGSDSQHGNYSKAQSAQQGYFAQVDQKP